MCPITNYVDFAFNEFFLINFNRMSNQTYYTWHVEIKIQEKKYFTLFSCALWFKISLKLHNGHKNEEFGKKYLGKRCLYYECEKWCETNNHIQYGPRHDEHYKFPIHTYLWLEK
jgi:hypothetical protein